MKITKTVTWVTKNGKNIEVKIERTKEVQEKTAYADGYNLSLGKETVDSLYIVVNADGKFLTRSNNGPDVLSEKFYGKGYKELKAKGAYARLGDSYISEENYKNLVAAIEEMETELTTDQEFEVVKAQKIAKEAREEKELAEAVERHERELKNGLCPKCGTYCYGDCEAN